MISWAILCGDSEHTMYTVKVHEFQEVLSCCEDEMRRRCYKRGTVAH